MDRPASGRYVAVAAVAVYKRFLVEGRRGPRRIPKHGREREDPVVREQGVRPAATEGGRAWTFRGPRKDPAGY
ncbi:MAG TPA: hypothetical protein HA263_06175 [Methanoregulaceae archaeon]|nr:hypothetical protein [Methanoregulaceae archaeon]